MGSIESGPIQFNKSRGASQKTVDLIVEVARPFVEKGDIKLEDIKLLQGRIHKELERLENDPEIVLARGRKDIIGSVLDIIESKKNSIFPHARPGDLESIIGMLKVWEGIADEKAVAAKKIYSLVEYGGRQMNREEFVLAIKELRGNGENLFSKIGHINRSEIKPKELEGEILAFLYQKDRAVAIFEKYKNDTDNEVSREVYMLGNYTTLLQQELDEKFPPSLAQQM